MNTAGQEKNRNPKYRKFSVHRGGQYAVSVARDLDLERWLDREMQSVHNAMRDPRGVTPSEGFAAIARDEQHPWRVQSRRLLEAILTDVPDEKVDAMPFVWVRFIQRAREAKRQGLVRVRVVSSTTPASPAAERRPAA